MIHVIEIGFLFLIKTKGKVILSFSGFHWNITRESIMEVLRPQLIRIDGRIYRKNPIQEQTYQHEEEDEDFCQGNPSCSLVR